MRRNSNTTSKKCRQKNILSDIDTREFKFLYPEAAEVLENPTLLAYDIREILSEKIRAIMTRRGTKVRDYIDIYLIQKQANIEAEDVEAQVMEKTKYMMRYEKYRKNIQQKTKNKPKFKLGDEEKLLLKPLNPQFHQFLKKFNKNIDKLITQQEDRKTEEII